MGNKLNRRRLVELFLSAVFTRVLQGIFPRCVNRVNLLRAFCGEIRRSSNIIRKSLIRMLRMLRNHRTWRHVRMSVAVYIEAYVDSARFFHHGILEHVVRDLPRRLIVGEREMTHGNHILTKFRKLWHLTFIWVMKFSGPLIALVG